MQNSKESYIIDDLRSLSIGVAGVPPGFENMGKEQPDTPPLEEDTVQAAIPRPKPKKADHVSANASTETYVSEMPQVRDLRA